MSELYDQYDISSNYNSEISQLTPKVKISAHYRLLTQSDFTQECELFKYKSIRRSSSLNGSWKTKMARETPERTSSLKPALKSKPALPPKPLPRTLSSQNAHIRLITNKSQKLEKRPIKLLNGSSFTVNLFENKNNLVVYLTGYKQGMKNQ